MTNLKLSDIVIIAILIIVSNCHLPSQPSDNRCSNNSDCLFGLQMVYKFQKNEQIRMMGG